MTDRTKALEKLLDPGKIAVIGASRSKTKVGGIVFRRLMDSRRRLYPVNPKETAIEGYKVFPDIRSLPVDIDLAVVTTAAASAVEAVKTGVAHGIPNYIVVAGGFGETDAEGRKLEEKLSLLARQHRLNILGPNSLGIFLPDENIDTIFVEHGDKALDRNGRVACVFQSGSVGVEALGYTANTGYGMRAFVGLGNKCDLDEIDFLRYFARDEKTNCIGFYLENIEKGRAFLREAKDVAGEKPVVVLKAGRSRTAASAVSSHTGKLAGSDNVVSGALNQFGIQRVYDDEEFCDATKVLSMLPSTAGNRVAVLTAAGGYGVMCTDYIEKNENRAPLSMAVLSQETRKKVRAATFPFTACENPVDITASADDRMFSESLDALMQDDGVDIVICIAFFAPPGITDTLIDIIAEKTRRSDKPLIVFTKYGPFTDKSIKNLFYAGVAAYPSVGRAVRAARVLVERNRIRSHFRKSGRKDDRPDGLVQSIEYITNPDEFDAKKLISRYGIAVPQGFRLGPADAFGDQAMAPPYVVKACTPGVIHKTDAQGVILNSDRESVHHNIDRLRQRFPGENILVEHQVAFEGPEMIIGIIRDPLLGHAVMVGAAG